MAKSIKSNPISKIAIELAATIGSFSNPAVLKGYYQAVITIDLFNNEEEYNDFYNLLAEYMIKINTSAIFDNSVSLSDQVIKPVVEVFKTMKAKYPKATDVFILEAVYDLKDPKYLKESLAYITSKDVVSKRLVERGGKNVPKYVTQGMLSSKTIMTYLRENSISQSEQAFIDTFLGADFAKNIFRYFKFDDLALCAKDPRFIDVALFSCYSLFQNKELTPEQRYGEFVKYVKGEIKNIDIEKMKFLFSYKYYEILCQSLDTITIEGLMSIEKYRDTFDKLIANSASLNVDTREFVIPDPTSIEFELVSSLTGKPVSQKENVPSAFKSAEFPVFVMNKYDMNKALAVRMTGKTITKKDWIKLMNELILSKKISLLIESCDRPEEIPEYLRKIKFSDEVISLLHEQTLEQDDNEVSDNANAGTSLRVLSKMLKEQIFTLDEALLYDADLLCDSLLNGQISIDMILFRRLRANIDKTKIIETSLALPELYEKLLASGNISKRDLYTLELSSYTQLVETFFNSHELKINEVLDLVKLGKISIADIETMNLSDIEITDEEIASIYVRIQAKKREYEKCVENKYQEADNQGIDDIPETEEERKLQSELQELIDLKNLYIVLFRKQNLSPLVQYHKTTDIYTEIVDTILVEDDFDRALSGITNMLYQDKLISMAQVREMDDNLFIEILKSGYARQEDIEKFKQEIVSLDEIEQIRTELSEMLSGQELEEAIRVEIYKLTYNRLYALMEKIAQDENTTKEEKLSMLYSIFSKNTLTEKTHREFFESEILVKIYGKIKTKRKKPIIDPNDEKDSSEEEELEEENVPKAKYSSREFVYPTNIIWNFIELLDSDFKFRILSDGYVVFESEKLNKAFIENVWQSNKDGDFVRRGYGSTTLILDIDTYKMHEYEIVRPGRHGYKVDVLKAKSHLPTVQTPKGPKATGMIIHEKDLKNTGKKIWFELILDHLGITQANVDSKNCQYTQEDLDKINNYIMNSRYRYEEITK